MNVAVFGVGAAGNKAAIEAIESGVISEDSVKLVNTTVKDIPDKYKMGKDLIVKFASMLGGCGKEPDKGYAAMVKALQDNKINFQEMVPEDTQEIVLVTSTEGGTGCGATPALVRYFNAMNLPVHVFALIGFQDEIRGIDNTLKFFQRLGDNVILHTIMNDKFLDVFTGSYSAAEKEANKEFARQLEIIIGSKTIPSLQNIDDTDRYKITTQTGYMDIKHIDISKVRNLETFDEVMIKAFNNGNNLEYDAGCKRLAIIVNASNKVQESIDSTLNVIKRFAGEPVETFRHIQNDESGDEYMDIIISGIQFPEKGFKDINKHYKEVKSKHNRESKSMNDIFSSIDIDDADEFDMNVKQRKAVDVNSLFDSVNFSTNVNKTYAKVNEVETIDNY